MGLFGKTLDEETEVQDIYNNKVFEKFKRVLHLYVVQDDKCLIKQNSFDASENKTLYDAPIVKQIPVHNTYYVAFLDAYREYTGRVFKQDSRGIMDIVEPKIVVDAKNRVITYILFAKDIDKIDIKALPAGKAVYEWLELDEFLKIIYSEKFAYKDSSYKDFIVYGLSEIYNIDDYIKKQSYTSNKVN